MFIKNKKKIDLRTELAAANVRIATLGKRLDQTLSEFAALREEVIGTKARLTQLEQSPYAGNRDEAEKERFVLSRSNPGIGTWDD